MVGSSVSARDPPLSKKVSKRQKESAYHVAMMLLLDENRMYSSIIMLRTSVSKYLDVDVILCFLNSEIILS